MALSLEGANLVKQKALAETRKPHVQALLKAFFSDVSQHSRNPDLQFVAFSALGSTDVVIADVACKLYVTYMKVPSTSDAATFVKQTDHASTASDAASEFRYKFGGSGASEDAVIYPKGYAMANGVTMQGTTTADGGTGSDAADGCSGFVIVGAP